MIGASANATRTPFTGYAELTFACDAGGVPSVALKNVSGTNMRVYADFGDPAPVGNPSANNATTTPISGAPADTNVDHVTYLTRGPVGTVRFEVWVENQGAPNATNCLFNYQVLGQGILTPSFG